MSQTMSIDEIRKHINRLPEQLSSSPEAGAVTVTRRGKPVLAVLSWEFYEAILETMEIMGDESLMDALRQGIQELQEGKGIPWDEAQMGVLK